MRSERGAGRAVSAESEASVYESGEEDVGVDEPSVDERIV